MQSVTEDDWRAALTPRQRQAADAMLEGLGYKELAQRLGLSVHTVDKYIGKVFEKAKVRNQAEFVGKALGVRMVPLPGLGERRTACAYLLAAGCSNAELARELGCTKASIVSDVRALAAYLGTPIKRSAIIAALAARSRQPAAEAAE
jgi:DNA-binding CsgD family transcriptional regulator